MKFLTWLATLALLALPGSLTGQNEMVRDPLPVPDIPGFKTLKGDFHAHTVFSDGELWPTLRAWEAWRDGLDVLAFTDHADLHPHAPYVSEDLTRPYALTKALADQLGLILIQGIELGNGNSHWNALFVTDPNAFKGRLPLQEVLRRARAQDAFVLWNHPGWPSKAEWSPEVDSFHREGLFQGIELINGSTVFKEVLPWGKEKKLAFLANSDIHAIATTRKRPVTLLSTRTRDAAGVREAFFAGRTAAWMGENVYGPAEYLRGLWDGAVKPENPELVWRPGAKHPRLLLRNHSAIPFRFRVLKVTDGFHSWGTELRGETVSPMSIGIGKDAPSGWNNVELELELTNLHTGSEGHPTVRLQVRVKVER